MLRAFEPWHLVVIGGVAMLLFGAKRLPDSARSVGQSLRIFRSEMAASRDGSPAGPGPAAQTAAGQSPTGQAPAAQPAPEPIAAGQIPPAAPAVPGQIPPAAPVVAEILVPAGSATPVEAQVAVPRHSGV